MPKTRELKVRRKKGEFEEMSEKTKADELLEHAHLEGFKEKFEKTSVTNIGLMIQLKNLPGIDTLCSITTPGRRQTGRIILRVPTQS
jgi:hypothetical protein